jgi:hypothetical protein
VYQGTKVNHRGFYWRYKEEGDHDCEQALTGEGFTIAWGLGKNVLDSDLSVTLRQIKAAVYMPVETEPVAHLSFDLFRVRRGRYVDNEEFVYCCDTFSQEVYDVACGITEGHLDVADYFPAGPVTTDAQLRNVKRESRV